MTLPPPLARSFSKAAERYQQHAELQRQIAKSLCATLEPGWIPQRAVDLGCGTGFLTVELSRRYPQTELHAVDISEGMLRLCEQQQRELQQVRIHLADARTFQSATRFELLASSSALQWMHPLDATLRHFRTLLAPQGRFLAAVMLDSTLGRLRKLRTELFPRKSPREILPSSAQLIRLLRDAGFRLRRYDEQLRQEYYDNGWALLRHLCAVGVSGSTELNSSGLLGRSELHRLCREYDRRYVVDDGRIAVDYHVAFFEAEIDDGNLSNRSRQV
jgi:malonyl-CoA O-methyltransferase